MHKKNKIISKQEQDNFFKNKKIVLCSQKYTKKLQDKIDKILEYIGFSEALTTDESKLFDFCLTKTQIKNLSKKLGFKIDENDKLIEIAKKMELK